MATNRLGRWGGVLVLAAVVVGCGDKPERNGTPDFSGLTMESFEEYKAKIGPQDFDKAWQQIDWITSYRTGLEAASLAQKPILLWVMNGHPLGCT